jgi:Na+/glutamate symporter
MADMGVASLALGQAVGAFQTYLPKLQDVRKTDANANPEFVADVRIGEIAAITVAVGTGAILSSLSKSPVPAVVAALVCGVMLCLYETTLQSDRPLERRTVVERMGGGTVDA